MSENTPLAAAAADVLAAAAPKPTDPTSDATRAEVEAIRRELARTRRLRTMRNRAMILGVAAALVVGIIALRRSVARGPEAFALTKVRALHGEIAIDHAGSSTGPSSTAAAGDTVHCKGVDCRADLILPSGSVATLHGESSVAIASTNETQILRLERGSARFDVVKLRPDERFIVKTLDAEIEVRGTTFRVTLPDAAHACASAARTQVDVSEGVVAVRHAGAEVLLAAGAHWPSTACPEPAAAPAPPVVSAGPPPTPSASMSAAAINNKKTTGGTSELSAQNALWADAVAAKKRGDNATALAAFSQYLAKYPNGFLAEAAEVERMRLLSGAARVAAARAYLARHPNGYARVEAQGIVDRGAP